MKRKKQSWGLYRLFANIRLWSSEFHPTLSIISFSLENSTVFSWQGECEREVVTRIRADAWGGFKKLKSQGEGGKLEETETPVRVPSELFEKGNLTVTDSFLLLFTVILFLVLFWFLLSISLNNWKARIAGWHFGGSPLLVVDARTKRAKCRAEGVHHAPADAFRLARAGTLLRVADKRASP